MMLDTLVRLRELIAKTHPFTVKGRTIKEVIGVPLTFVLSREYIEDQENFKKPLKDFYDTHNSEKSFGDKYEQEASHYKMLWSILEHKENETQYYFKEGVYTSRKLIAQSSDCITTIQIMIRERILFVNVFMRSSDVLGLLPVDIYGILKGVRNMFWAKWFELRVNILIGSAHIYVDGTREHKLEGTNQPVA